MRSAITPTFKCKGNANCKFFVQLEFTFSLYDRRATMQAVCFQSVGEVATLDIADPQIQSPHDAVVRVSMAGLCGSDLHPFWGREIGLLPGTVMGHEMVGTVEAVGSMVDSKKIAVGDRVYVPFSTNCGDCYYCHAGLTSRCESGQLFGWRNARPDLDAPVPAGFDPEAVGLHGCQSEFVKVPMAAATLKRLPDSVSDEQGLLLGDNFSTGYFCAEMAEIKPGGDYAIVGCGTVGLLCIIAAGSMGAENIIAIDPVPERRKQAEAFGAIGVAPEKAVDEIKTRTKGRGVEAVMELVGIPDAQQLAYQIIRAGGIMSVIGCHCGPNFAFAPSDAYDKNLTYKTGRCPARHYMDVLTDRVAAGEFELAGLINREFDFDDSKRAYDVFSNRKDGCVKAVFRA